MVQNFIARWHRLSRLHFLQRTRYSNQGTGGRRLEQDVLRQVDGPQGQDRAVQVFARHLLGRDEEVHRGLFTGIQR
jgi:hypothetical protein